ncbi:hypothetical protein HU200_017286 [Digitaria exilis]|uniref:Uncharacterized protein n=1 Tax=Digitaria exilis TaxID=1010633 RepID=A0A835F7H9_9POAL|nr:hypothetical protein HU200_017286 [Digitaria exilis]
MACINMYNPDGAAGFGGGPQPPAAPLGPRISFSSDFAVEPPPPVQNRAMSLRCQEEDLNFEFSVGSHPMMAADQLFSKGRILPLKDNGACFAGRPPTTLRDELRGGGDDDERASAASKGSTSSRWKEMLGLRKALCVGGGIGGGAAKKGSSSDKGVVADADMVVVTDMAASNQVGDRSACVRSCLSLILVDTLSHHRFVFASRSSRSYDEVTDGGETRQGMGQKPRAPHGSFCTPSCPD